MKALNERRAEAEALTGQTVSTIHLDIERMLERGLLVTMHVYGTGAFDYSLDLAQLGIDGSREEVKERIKAGRSSVFPEMSKRVGSWSTQCRNAFRRYCITLPIIDNLTASNSWRLLLFSGYDDFREKMEQLDALITEIKAEAIARRDEMIENQELFWRNEARENWVALQARYENGVALSVPGHTFGPDDRVAYEEWVVGKALEAIPTDEQIMGIHSAWSTSILFSNADMAREDALIYEAEARKARAKAEILDERARELRLRKDTMALEAYEAAVRQIEMERARAEIAENAEPLTEIIQALFAEIEKVTTDLLAKFKRNGCFRGRTLERAHGLKDVWRIMGGEFVSDNELGALIKRLSEITEKDREDVTTQQIAENLTEIAKHVRSDEKLRPMSRIRRKLEVDL